LQDDPNQEDQSCNDPDLNFLLAGPFPVFHFPLPLAPFADVHCSVQRC
jgi:hypothetical protein